VRYSDGCPSPTPPPTGTPPSATPAPPASGTPTAAPTLPPGSPSATPPLATATRTGTATGTPGPTATACAIQYSDVLPGSPFYSYGRCLACRWILSGYSASPPCAVAPCFNGGAPLIRGQVAKIVTNAAGFFDPIPSGQQSFTDVPPGNPFWLFVERASVRGVI